MGVIAKNKLAVITNPPYQGGHLKVLCVCSGGVLRSPVTINVYGFGDYLTIVQK